MNGAVLLSDASPVAPAAVAAVVFNVYTAPFDTATGTTLLIPSEPVEGLEFVMTVT
jgi:hypothetical protein